MNGNWDHVVASVGRQFLGPYSLMYGFMGVIARQRVIGIEKVANLPL